jgi:hypothetical protein
VEEFLVEGIFGEKDFWEGVFGGGFFCEGFLWESEFEGSIPFLGFCGNIKLFLLGK